MKKIGVILFLAAGCLLRIAAQELVLTAGTDKPDARYKRNETATFHVSLKDASGKAVSGKTIHYLLTGDAGLKREGTLTSGEEPQILKATQKVPGFILLKTWLPETPRKPVCAGAGFEPEKIVPATPEPADFDAFWAKELEQLKKRASNMKITVKEIMPYPKYKDSCRMYDIRLEDGVLNATGTLAVPIQTKEKGHPIIMTFNGASGIGSASSNSLSQARSYNALVFHMNLHDTVNYVPKREDVIRMRKLPQIRGYQFRDADKPEKYGVGDVFRRVLRCREYLKTRPEWDGKTIIVRGGSLGGAQAIVAAANDPYVKLCVAGAPAMCNHLGWKKDQFSGWPNLFRNSQYVRDAVKRAGAEKTMPYFDIVNFAKRVRCDTVMSVGFIDAVCPATSVYAAYNVLGTPKKVMYEVPLGDHGFNHDPSPKKKPGVFGYGGSQVSALIRALPRSGK